MSEVSAKAEVAHAQSQFELAAAFFRVDRGVAKDDSVAAKWLRKAAEQDHAIAQNDLGGRLSHVRQPSRNQLIRSR